jgi:hypothetical protein
MRVPFANRLTRFGRHKDETETEAGQVVDLNEPVILFPAEHISPHQEIERARWKRPGVVVATTATVFVLGAGVGIMISKRSGGAAAAVADAGPLTMETSALALPDEDLRIAPTARDSGPGGDVVESRPTASVTGDSGTPASAVSRTDQPTQELLRAPPIVAAAPARDPVSVTAGAGPERRPQPQPETAPGRDSTAVLLAANQPLLEGAPPVALGSAVDDDSVVDDPVGNEQAAPDSQVAPIDTTPTVQLPDPDPDPAADPPAPSVPEPLPVRDSFTDLADRSSAGPVLRAGVGQLIDAINSEDWEQRVRPFLLDPVSQREVVKFLRDEEPTASLGTVDEVQFDGGEAKMIVRLGFKWRGSFGVEERETRRFVAVARPENGEWLFHGVVLTGDLP